MAKRKFDTFTTNHQNSILLRALVSAMEGIQQDNFKRKSDIIGLACKRASNLSGSKICRKDFEGLIDLTLRSIIQDTEQRYPHRFNKLVLNIK